MKKQALLMVVFLAAVGLLAGVAASTAGANAGGLGGLPCGMTGCHGSEGTVPVVTLELDHRVECHLTASPPRTPCNGPS